MHDRPSFLTSCNSQVGTVTVICTLCFLARAVFIILATVDREEYSLDVLEHPLLNIAFYCAVEIVPSALVLYILRKLPPKQPPQAAAQSTRVYSSPSGAAAQHPSEFEA